MENYQISAPADRDAFYQLYLYAFNKQDSVQRHEFFDARFNHATDYGIHAGGQLVSALYSLPFTVNFAGQEFKMRGIGDVCSAPEFSGRGGAGTLMTAALQDMYTEGTSLSYLAPFAFSYYRRFGYEQVFNQIHYELNTSTLPRFKTAYTPAGKITRGRLQDNLDVAKAVYTANQPTQGGLVRADWWWDYLVLKNDWDVGIYTAENGHATGYVIYERAASTLTIKELIAPTQAEYLALRQFILKHGNSFDRIVYEAPSTAYTGDLLPEPGIATATVVPYMMARIVNLQDVLNRLPLRLPETAITIAIEDSLLTANQGTWSISASGPERIATELMLNADARMTIQTATKLIFGVQSATNLLRSGELTATSAAVAVLNQLGTNITPALVDYF